MSFECEKRVKRPSYHIPTHLKWTTPITHLSDIQIATHIRPQCQ